MHFSRFEIVSENVSKMNGKRRIHALTEQAKIDTLRSGKRPSLLRLLAF
jgi:hypothetical protein